MHKFDAAHVEAARRLVGDNKFGLAVKLPPGEHTVVFTYRPLSVRVGGLVTAISLAVLIALGGLVIGGRRGGNGAPASVAQRIFRNSAFPMAALSAWCWRS